MKSPLFKIFLLFIIPIYLFSAENQALVPSPENSIITQNNIKVSESVEDKLSRHESIALKTIEEINK